MVRMWTRCTAPLIAVMAAMLVANGAAAQAAGFDPDTVRRGALDYGKMWTFEYPPTEHFRSTYGFEADAAWFERARLAALRIPGCSAALVSERGLVVTNHHCIRSRVSAVSAPGETLLDSGFYAPTAELERPIPGYYADQLIAVRDVSEEVLAALDAAAGPQARAEARRAAQEAIVARERERHAAEGADIVVQVIELYHGGRYSAYVFRRYHDVRLVAAAELQMGFFGGDPDNFTYPRYALDFGFLRIYGDDGEPLRSAHHFEWSTAGVEEGDAIFVIGNPGPTNRLNTVAQLEYQRDVLAPAQVAFLTARLDAMRAFIDAYPEEAEALDMRNRAFSLSNSLKAWTGRLAALGDPVIMARKAAAEREFRAAIAGTPALADAFGGLLDEMAAVQARKQALAPAFAASLGLGNANAGSALLRRGVGAVQWDNARQAGAPADVVAQLHERATGGADHPATLERAFLAARLEELRRHLGQDHPGVRAALAGREPAAAAAALLEASAFDQAASAAAALAGGAAPANDPALALARALLPTLAEYERAAAAAAEEEAALAGRLGRARFEVYGTDVAPDATSSPRITDGRVLPYAYNGTLAPVYTTFYGVYDHFNSYGPDSDWNLPHRWVTPPAGLELGTPLNFISTADTYGGNSGSPAVTPELRIVGLNFDRNIEGLSRDFIYLPERGRNIMVDVRAILEALDVVYDADRLVLELTTGRYVPSEAEADAIRR